MQLFSSWKKRLTRTSLTHKRRFSAPMFKPRLELLEDRTLLSPYIVTTTVDAGAGSLRDAINQTNADTSHALYASPSNPNMDEINFMVTGRIRLGSAFPALRNNVAIVIRATATVDGAEQFQVFHVENGVSVSISGLTIQGGRSADYGGGIYNAGTLTVSNCFFDDDSVSLSSGSGGGAIYNAGMLTVSSSTFENSAASNGGGIYNAGTLTVNNSFFGRNNAWSSGGGIYNTGTLTVSNTTFDFNNSTDFRYGTAFGGGIYNAGALTLSNSTLVRNVALNGGGIYNTGTLKVSNSTLAENHGGYGGAIYFATVSSLESVLTNVTIAYNSGFIGGGICSSYGPSLLTLNNTIVASNSPSYGYHYESADISGPMNYGSAHNLIGIGGSGGLDASSGNQVGVADPGLRLLGHYGGRTLTVPLMTGSPAIDAGNNALAVDASGAVLSTDQRGPGFQRIYNGPVDIGAFEAQPVTLPVNFTVTNTNDSDPGSLRQAIMDAELRGTLDGGPLTINFAIPTTDPGYNATTGKSTITLTTGELDINLDLTIVGPGANQLAVSGNNATRVFEISSGASVSISGVTIEDGRSMDGSTVGGARNSGGGIYSGGILTISNSSFSGNSASRDGGAIFGGILTVSNSTFSGNSSLSDHGGAIFSGSILTVNNSTFVGNFALAGGGGAIMFYGAATVKNCTFSGNSAQSGGGIANGNDTVQPLTVSSCTFTGNSATGGDGGGLFFVDAAGGSRFIVANSTFSGNSAGEGGGISFFNLYGGQDEWGGLINVAFVDNRADYWGGGFFFQSYSGGLSPPLSNTIVARNAAPIGPDVFGDVISNGNNLIGDGSGRSGFGVPGDQVGTASSPIDPLLAPLGNYGGPTQTMPLLPGSPAIDAGSNALAVDASGNPLTTDQRGLPRVVNGTVDIGAVEAQPVTLRVTNTSNSGPGSLQQYVQDNNLLGGGNTILFQASSTFTPAGVIQAVNALTNVAQPVTIILDLGGGTYTTDTPANPPANVTFVVQNGTLVGGSPALIVAGGSVVVQHATLTTATDAPTILVTGGSLTLRNDIVQESTRFTDAAIAVTGGTVDLGTAASPGNNTININGSGQLVQNSTPNAISAVGNTFEAGGMTLTAPNLTFTALSTSLASSILNQAVTLTATVRGNGAGTPAGSVDFLDTTTNTDLGSVVLSGGTASLKTSRLTVGSHLILATYSGNGSFLPSIASLTETVHYNFSGFLPPLNQNIAFGLNRTIPIKFQLSDFNGTAITSLSSVISLKVAPVNADNTVGTPFNPASQDNKGLRYGGEDAQGQNQGQENFFHFYWQTKGLKAGNYEILLTLADGTVKTKVIQLSTNGKGGSTQMALGSGAGDNSGLADTLLAGDLNVHVNDPNGSFTADELARIQDTIKALDTLLTPYGVTITEVGDAGSANLVLDNGTTSACGGAADGVLGCFNGPAGEITILQGWNWYAGADSTQIGLNQYDFESVVTHELGHALGLGHSPNAASPMYETLATGQIHRMMTVADLNLIEPPQGADPERAAPLAWATVNFLDVDHVGQHSNADNLTGSQDWNPDPRAAHVRRISNPSYWESTTSSGSRLLEKNASAALLSHYGPRVAPEADNFWSSFAAARLLTNAL